jgi:hypothetical protein
MNRQQASAPVYHTRPDFEYNQEYQQPYSAYEEPIQNSARDTFLEAPEMEEAYSLPRKPRAPSPMNEPMPMPFYNNISVPQEQYHPPYQGHFNAPVPLNSNRNMQQISPFTDDNRTLTEEFGIRAASPPKEKLAHTSFNAMIQHEPRCIYYCIPTNRKSRYICLGITGFIVVVLGILAFLFYPRMPSMQVMSINVNPGSGFKLEAYDATKDPISFSFEMDMTMIISVVNSNRYRMKIEGIDLKVFLWFT